MADKNQTVHEIVKNHMWYSMGAGLIPIPIVDLAAVGGVQLRMINELSKVYEVPFSENRGKAVLASLLGFLVPAGITYGVLRQALKAVPGLGSLAGGLSLAASSGAATYAVGRVFISHFESGGTFLTFDPEKVKAYFLAQFEEGRKLADVLKKDEVTEEEQVTA